MGFLNDELKNFFIEIFKSTDKSVNGTVVSELLKHTNRRIERLEISAAHTRVENRTFSLGYEMNRLIEI